MRKVLTKWKVGESVKRDHIDSDLDDKRERKRERERDDYIVMLDQYNNDEDEKKDVIIWILFAIF